MSQYDLAEWVIIMKIKKFMIVLLSLICVVGCAGCKSNEVTQMNEVAYKEGIFPVRDWNEVGYPFEKDCVTGKETAICIGNALLSQFQNQGYFPAYTLQEVFNDVEREIWVLSYWKAMCVGSTFSIAINKKDGQVIHMWVED